MIFGRVEGRLHRRSRRRRRLLARQPGRYPPRARCRAAHGHAAAVPDSQDGSRARQHRCLAPRGSRRDARRSRAANWWPTSRKARSCTGVVKNITDYGAFVDLGGVDGLLHVTDIAWRRINHPSEALHIGQQRHRAGHPLQSRNAAHHPRHEAARGRSVGRRCRQVPGGHEVQGPRHQHHRLRRLRGAGARHRRSGARFRNELDQEERPPGQDRVDEPGSRSDDPRRRPAEAPHQPRLEAVLPQSVGDVQGEVRRRHRARGRGQEQDRVRSVRRPARRHRRHGPSLRPRLEQVGRGSHQGLREGPDGQGQGARGRSREGAHLAWHQAAPERSLREGFGRIQEGRRRHLHRDRRSRKAASTCR